MGDDADELIVPGESSDGGSTAAEGRSGSSGGEEEEEEEEEAEAGEMRDAPSSPGRREEGEGRSQLLSASPSASGASEDEGEEAGRGEETEEEEYDDDDDDVAVSVVTGAKQTTASAAADQSLLALQQEQQEQEEKAKEREEGNEKDDPEEKKAQTAPTEADGQNAEAETETAATPDLDPSAADGLSARARAEMIDIAYFRNVALRSGAYLERPRLASHGIDVFEGANLHTGSTGGRQSGRWLCSYSGKLCMQRRNDGWGFCNKHHLEDPRAPVAQCQFVSKQHGRRCQLPVALADHSSSLAQHASGMLDTRDNASDPSSVLAPEHSDTLFDARFCGSHKQSLGLTMPRGHTIATHLKKARKDVERALARAHGVIGSGTGNGNGNGNGNKVVVDRNASDVAVLREHSAEPDWFFRVIVDAGLGGATPVRAQQREYFVSEFLRHHHVQSSALALRALRRLEKKVSGDGDGDDRVVVDTADAQSSSDDDFEYGSALPFAAEPSGNPGVESGLGQNRTAARPGGVPPPLFSSSHARAGSSLDAAEQQFMWEMLERKRGDSAAPPADPTDEVSSYNTNTKGPKQQRVEARKKRLMLLRAAYQVQFDRIYGPLVTGVGDSDVAGIRVANQRDSDAPYPLGVVGSDDFNPDVPSTNLPTGATADFLMWKTSVLFRREQARYTLHKRLHVSPPPVVEEAEEEAKEEAPLAAAAAAASSSSSAPQQNPASSSLDLDRATRCHRFDECGRRALPESGFCFFHIRLDPHQQLFESCQGRISSSSSSEHEEGDSECGYPVVCGANPPLCAECRREAAEKEGALQSGTAVKRKASTGDSEEVATTTDNPSASKRARTEERDSEQQQQQQQHADNVSADQPVATE
jgi:Potential DNA-binding domain